MILNRYDRLLSKQKKLRNKVTNKTNKSNSQVQKLREKILKIQYNQTVYCSAINNKIIDVTSLISNEQRRIMDDAFELEENSKNQITPNKNK